MYENWSGEWESDLQSSIHDPIRPATRPMEVDVGCEQVVHYDGAGLARAQSPEVP